MFGHYSFNIKHKRVNINFQCPDHIKWYKYIIGIRSSLISKNTVCFNPDVMFDLSVSFFVVFSWAYKYFFNSNKSNMLGNQRLKY